MKFSTDEMSLILSVLLFRKIHLIENINRVNAGVTANEKLRRKSEEEIKKIDSLRKKMQRN